ncbi:hypothetical protein BH10ACI4_BH10ACI4_34220 [soil metagenome]
MRMRFCVSLVAISFVAIILLTSAAVAQQSVAPRARLKIPAPNGQEWRVRVALDRRAKGSAARSVKVIAAMAGAMVVVDTYPSRAGGMHLCQAGEESFLRVFRTTKYKATETFHEKLESCRDNIELASPGLQWTAETKTLNVEWLSSPGKAGQGGKQKLEVGANAGVKSIADWR